LKLFFVVSKQVGLKSKGLNVITRFDIQQVSLNQFFSLVCIWVVSNLIECFDVGVAEVQL
jgi:hypothetical protein